MTLLPLLFLCLPVQETASEPLPEVLIVGTFHMASPNQDLINPNVEDVLSERRQEELAGLVASLARFEPTHVAVEATPEYEELINGRYQRFLEGALAPERDEFFQVAFPLAAESHLERVDAIDFALPLPMGPVMAHAAQEQPWIAAHLDKGIEDVRKEFEVLMKRPIPEIFRAMNTPDEVKEHGFYMLAAQVGTSDDPLGARMAADWHTRNLIIFGNVARLAREPGDRVLVLIGAGHAPLLRDFVRRSPNLRLANVLDYLD